MASRSWNRVELIGNLTRDPELRYTPNGAAVCTFGVATNRTYVSEGEKKEEVDFHKLVSWNKLAELCNQLLKKGNRVFVSGRLQTRSWEGADGAQRQTTEIVVEDMILLTPRAIGEPIAEPEVAEAEEKEKKAASAEGSGPLRQSLSGASEPKEEESKPEKKAAAAENTPTPPSSGDQEEVDDLPF